MMSTDPNFPKPWRNISWIRHEAGTWMPQDHNEFHGCPLYETTHREFRVYARKTMDGKGWVARARTLAPALKASVPYGKIERSRIRAFWKAVERCRRLSEVRGA